MFNIGQKFKNKYPLGVSEWCINNNAFIEELERDEDNNRVFEIKEIIKTFEEKISDKIQELKNKKELKKSENLIFMYSGNCYVIKASETTIVESNKKTNKLQYLKTNSETPSIDDLSWVADGIIENDVVIMIGKPLALESLDYALCLFSCIDDYFQKLQNNYVKIKSEIQDCTTEEELNLVNIDNGWDSINNDCTPS